MPIAIIGGRRLRSGLSPPDISPIAPTDFAKLMKAFTDLHLKTYLSILIMVLFGPLGNVLLGKGMKRIGAVAIRTPAELIHTLILVFSSSVIWLGIASLITFFLTYMLVLSWADYSYVQPASSIAYGVVALLGHFLLKEVITPTRWLGVLVICLGVFIVSGTPPRTTEQL
jgi:drug/metabolite transporter (DMT)-like permease